MLASLKAFFSSVPSWLIILKYAGLTLAAGSTVWATVNVLTVTSPDGSKRITSAGVVAIGLTVLGLAISIVSEDLQRRHAAEVSKDQVAREAKRTNAIIISGQPLTSLSLDWSLQGLDSDLAQILKRGDDAAMAVFQDQQGERDSQQNGALFREEQLYPFLRGLARHSAKDSATTPGSSVVTLIALDDDANTVLPFGHLESEVLSGWLAQAKNANGPHPLSVETDSHADLGNTDLQNWPSLEASESGVTISWLLDPSTFAKSINRQNSFVVPTAKLPNLLRIAILFDIKELPFEAANFALPYDQNFWNFPDYTDGQNENFRGNLDPITKDATSSVRLVPNNSALVAYSYKLNRVYETLFLDSYGEASGELHCVIFEYNLEE